MTIKVFYEYACGNDYPFRAMCWIDERKFVGTSRLSYEAAKADLLTHLPFGKAAPEVPEPETVEV